MSAGSLDSAKCSRGLLPPRVQCPYSVLAGRAWRVRAMQRCPPLIESRCWHSECAERPWPLPWSAVASGATCHVYCFSPNLRSGLTERLKSSLQDPRASRSNEQVRPTGKQDRRRRRDSRPSYRLAGRLAVEGRLQQPRHQLHRFVEHRLQFMLDSQPALKSALFGCGPWLSHLCALCVKSRNSPCLARLRLGKAAPI